MRLFSSIFILLLQCASPLSFAAKGHTTNNGGNLAEIRFTDAWKTLPARMAPCLTPQNLCRLNPGQLSVLQSAVQNISKVQMTMPAEELLYRAGGKPKSETEMFEVVLAMLQTCGEALTPMALQEIALRASEISEFSRAQIPGGQTWFAFQRGGLFIEHAGGVMEFTPKFRALLRLAPDAPVEFKRVWMQRDGGTIEIGGRMSYEKGIRKENGFTLLISPLANGTIPPRTELSVFK